MPHAILNLKSALDEQDSYGVLPDATPVFLDHENCQYELSVMTELGRCLTLGDLRAIVSEADQ